jgi:DNA-binding NtrC family response regulator
MALGPMLIVDDDPGVANLLSEVAEEQGWKAESVGSGKDALARLEAGLPGLLLLDLGLPDGHGAEFLETWRKRWPDLAVVVISGSRDLDVAVQCMRSGAFDYVSKPFVIQDLIGTLRSAWHRAALEEETRTLRTALEHGRGLQRLLGTSTGMRQLRERLEKVAGFEVGVLLSGESGTGKEAAAEALHALSPRDLGPFVSVDCGALPANLLEAELFGYEKGAFTGASARKLGRVELAHEGVLFLDEIGNLPPALQPKLLRFLQERKFQRLGGSETKHVDLRVLAATNVDLRAQVAEGRFRQDLYYRLVEIEVVLPPLRSREGDILELARAFALQFSERFGRKVPVISGEAQQAMQNYPWPGNVRELLNTVRKACLLAGPSIEVEHLSLGSLFTPIAAWSGKSLAEVLDREKARVEQLMLQRALAANNSMSAAAKALGIDIKTLHVKIKRHGMVAP